jgi:hypothetical protein
MPAGWAAAAAVGGTLVGGYLQGQAAKSAANTSADAQRYAADRAASAAAFTPYSVTTRFGTGQFDTANQTAGYTTSPELKAIQDRIMAQAGEYDPTRLAQAAQGLYPAAGQLFNLGGKYLETSPEQAAQDWLANQRNLLAPGYEQALANVRNQQYQTGRTGLSVGGTSQGYGGVGSPGLLATNPEMQALYNARQQQEFALAAQADQYGQQRTQFGAGLFDTGANLLSQVPSLTTQGYGPLQTQLGLGATIEQLAQSPLDIGAQLGGRAATAGATQGQYLLSGGINAARTQQAANAYSPLGSTLTGFGQSPMLNSWFNQYLNQSGKAAQQVPVYGGSTNFFGGASPTVTGGADWGDLGYGVGV